MESLEENQNPKKERDLLKELKKKDELMKGIMEKWVIEYKEGNLEITF